MALVRLSDTGAWQFPSVLPGRDEEPLGAQLDTALSVAKQQLGLELNMLVQESSTAQLKARWAAAACRRLPSRNG